MELVDSKTQVRYVITPTSIESGQTAVTVAVQLPPNQPVPAQLTFRATGAMPGYVSVVSEAHVRVHPLQE